MAGSARHASRSMLQRKPPLLSASAASLSRLRPSSSGSGIRRSPFLSDRPPSRRMSSSARKCWVVPRRPVAPSMTTPIVRSGIRLPLDFSPQRHRGHRGGNPHPLPGESRDPPSSFRAADKWVPAFAGTPISVVCPLCLFGELLLHGGGDGLAQDLRDLVEDLVRG